MERKPNTICKNANCTKGSDGGRKHYYSCRYCVASGSWRSIACCPECLEAYSQQVAEARSKGVPVDVLPERTDLSRSEVSHLILTKDMTDAAEHSKRELADILESNPGVTLEEAVDLANSNIEKGSRRKKAKKT